MANLNVLVLHGGNFVSLYDIAAPLHEVVLFSTAVSIVTVCECHTALKGYLT